MYGKIFSLFLSFFKNAQIELLLLLLLYCACFNWNGSTTYGIRALQHPIPISLQWSAWVMMVPVTEKLPFICLTISAEKKHLMTKSCIIYLWLGLELNQMNILEKY